MSTIPAGLDVVLDLGFGVFPCRTKTIDDKHKVKSPLVPHGKDDASTDKHRIAEWASEFPGCAWGARPPPHIAALDIDTKKADGYATLTKLESEHGALPETLTNRTPSAGQHRVFTVESVYLNRAGVRPGLDVRTNSGYILVPPSVITDPPYAGSYEWADPLVPIAHAPEWLIEQVFAYKTKVPLSGTVQDGGRNDTLYRYACLLRAKALTDQDGWAALQARNRDCDPPLDNVELETIFNNAWKHPPGFDEPASDDGLTEKVRAVLAGVKSSVIVLPNDHVPIPYAAERAFDIMGAGRELFTRGGRIVELERDSTVSIVTPEQLCSRIQRNGRRVMQVNKDRGGNGTFSVASKQCSIDTARLLAAELAAKRLPPIALISDSAVLIEHEGELVVLGKGYHEFAGGVLVRGAAKPPIVTLEEAVSALSALFGDFLFIGESDRSRATAQMIGPALRFSKLVRGHAPMSAAEAKRPQSGKGYLVKLTRTPYKARAYDITNKAGGVGSVDETLADAIVRGYSFIAFENWRGRLDSQPLEHALTSHELFSARIPFKGAVLVDASRTMFQLTSNGVEGTPDLAARMLLVRLDKRPGDHPWHVYAEGDLLTHAEARCDYYLGCIHAVIRHWHAAGKPVLPTTHTFREWVGTLDWIVQKVFELPPLLKDHDSAVVRISNPALSWLRVVTHEVIRRRQCERELSASALIECGEAAGSSVPGTKADSTEETTQRIAGRVLGQCFREAPDGCLTIDDITVHRIEKTDEEQRPIKRYLFKDPTGDTI